MNNLFQPREYVRVKDLEEATQLLSKFGGRARVIAGGTDLLVSQPSHVECLVDLSKLNLSYIREDEEGIKIGAATPLASAEDSPLLNSNPYRVVIEAVSQLATPTIRNMATVGGNLCNASPAADLAPALMVLDAKMTVVGAKGKRQLPIGDFFQDVKKTVLGEDDFLVEVLIPRTSTETGAAFQKLRHHQTAIDIAIVNAAARLTFSDKRCSEARVALGAVAKTPIYAKKAEEVLVGKEIDQGLMEKAASVAAEESRPIDDIRASVAYRKKMVGVLVRRALEESARRCGVWPK